MKQTKPKNQVTTIYPVSAITEKGTSEKATSESITRVLKIGTCPSLSGKSTLTYHIGCAVNGEGICTAESDGPEAGIQFRVYANSGAGFFSNEWVSLNAIQQVFAKSPNSIISFVLHPLFRGKSLNTHAFLLAVLKQEGLVRPSKENRRCYERLDPTGFMAEVKALMASTGAPSNAAKAALPPKGKKKAEASPS